MSLRTLLWGTITSSYLLIFTLGESDWKFSEYLDLYLPDFVITELTP